MVARRILTSGASIAGPTLAYWLNTHGWSTTVIDRLDALRDDGQNIDVRGAGRQFARRMGIEEAIWAASKGEVGTQFLDCNGDPIASFPASKSESGGPTTELEQGAEALARRTTHRAAADPSQTRPADRRPHDRGESYRPPVGRWRMRCSAHRPARSTFRTTL